MKTETINRQTLYSINRKNIRGLLRFLAEKAQHENTDIHWNTVNLILTDDAGITEANQRCFQREQPTDVITQTYTPSPLDNGAYSADVIVNLQRARQEGMHHDGPEAELAFYIAHGFLHLTGADDATPNARKAMHKKQAAWLCEAAAEGLMQSFFEKKEIQ